MSIAFIVDGQTEKKIIQRICPDAPIRMTNLNGRDVSIAAIAKLVSSFIKLLKGRYYPVLVLIDREGRPQTSAEIERSLFAELTECYGISETDIIVSCPDRMIENWMLADPELFHRLHEITVEPGLEGSNGKKKIKQYLFTKGLPYHELTIGVDIFNQLDPLALRKNSPSFSRMAERVEVFCRWLRATNS